MNAGKIFSLAEKHFTAKNYDAALKILNKLKKIEPSFRKTYVLESDILRNLYNPVRETAAIEKALSMTNLDDPQEQLWAARGFLHLGYALIQLGMNEAAIKNLCLGAKYTTDKSSALSALSTSISVGSCTENFSAEDLRALYAEYKKLLADIKPYPRKFYDHEKIRVGFLSSDLCWHPVLKWTWPLLTSLDKNRFVCCFYANVEKPDNLTDIVRSHADIWRDIKNLSDEEAARLIRDDEIDILFDLNGHTSGNRLPVAAYHPASVQMSGIGYTAGTGLDFFEYFLADVHCAGNPEYFTEKLIRLPHTQAFYESFIKYKPAYYPPCVRNGFVTFGCFNQFKKITDTMLAAWKKILDAVPDSRLLLKHKFFDTDDGKIFVGKRLKNFGFDLSRVELRGQSATHPADYNDMDIALDTFPYTGVTTTAEALYMGVPVVSLYGDRFGTRLGLSILKNVGLEYLAVDSYDEYIKRAVMLANDWELLSLLRKNLRATMKNSPLMDAKLYVSEMQDAFVKILDEQKNLWRGEDERP